MKCRYPFTTAKCGNPAKCPAHRPRTSRPPKEYRCPKCGGWTRAKDLHEGGGVECTRMECNWWYCA